MKKHTKKATIALAFDCFRDADKFRVLVKRLLNITGDFREAAPMVTTLITVIATGPGQLHDMPEHVKLFVELLEAVDDFEQWIKENPGEDYTAYRDGSLKKNEVYYHAVGDVRVSIQA